MKPIYETVPGWQTDVTGARCLGDLPVAAISYIRHLEKLIDRKIEYVSVGPDRAQTIHIEKSVCLDEYLKTRAV